MKAAKVRGSVPSIGYIVIAITISIVINADKIKLIDLMTIAHINVNVIEGVTFGPFLYPGNHSLLHEY